MNISEIIKTLQEVNNLLEENSIREDSMQYDIANSQWEKNEISVAKRARSAQITEKTYLIMTLSKEHLPYKTLLLDLDGEHFKAKESTTILLNRYFSKLGMEQDIVNECQKLLFDRPIYKMPYVFNGKAFMPLTAVQKKAGTWIATHLIRQYGISAETKNVWVEFENKVKLLLDINEYSFNSQIDRIVKIQQVQEKLTERICHRLMGQKQPQHYLLERRRSAIDSFKLSEKENSYYKSIINAILK